MYNVKCPQCVKLDMRSQGSGGKDHKSYSQSESFSRLPTCIVLRNWIIFTKLMRKLDIDKIDS